MRVVEGSSRIAVRPRLLLRPLDRRGVALPIIRGGATGTSMTDYLENALLNEVLRNTNFAAVATVYAGLTTAQAAPEAGTVTEVAGNAYARQAVTFAAPDASGTCFNSVQVTFPVATPGGWGTLTGVILCDALTTGNILLYGTLTSSQVINAGSQYIFNVNQLSVQFD